MKKEKKVLANCQIQPPSGFNVNASRFLRAYVATMLTSDTSAIPCGGHWSKICSEVGICTLSAARHLP